MRIADDYAAIARRMAELQAKSVARFALPEGMVIVNPMVAPSSSFAIRSASWVFVLEYAGLRLVKTRNKEAQEFIDLFHRFLPSAYAVNRSLIGLSQEDHHRLSEWLSQHSPAA